MKRLCNATLSSLPHAIAAPLYDRSSPKIGVLHIGPGAFFRAHQAPYFDNLLTSDDRWSVTAVSLKSTTARDTLQPQDGLYTLSILDEPESLRVIGSLSNILAARSQMEQVRGTLLSAGLRLITITATEKGYCLTADGGLDDGHPDIRHDLETPDAPPRSVPGLLVEALRLRRAAGLPPPAVLSCDNLVRNGAKLRGAVVDLASQLDRDLAGWIAGEVAFPCTMVDSITPATDTALRDTVADALGVVDAWPVQREGFSQWIIEDSFRDARPDLDRVGVVFTNNVAAFEQAKLRLLNGAHSSLAYIGVLLGHETVAEAMSEPRLAAFVETLLRHDIAPLLDKPRGLCLDQYIDAILRRFRNGRIRHLLSQIAWDGSQKLPYRLLDSADALRAAGRPLDRIALPVAAWMRFVVARSRGGLEIVDPLAPLLMSIGREAGGDPKADVSRFLQLAAIFPRDIAACPRFRRALESAYAAFDVSSDGTAALYASVGCNPLPRRRN